MILIMNKRKINSKDILLWILKAGGIVILSLINPKIPQILLDSYLRKQYRLKERLRILEKRGWIDISESSNQIKLELVEKGKKKAMFYNLDFMKIKKPKIWDGLWRMVIFDIPEEKRLARDILRRRLKQLNLQKSAFIHPYDCRKEVEIIRTVYGIKPYVTYMEINNIDRRDFLLKNFGL